ncbi:hypothetical protein ACFVRR_15085 [Gottfriedia sp. NPDC057948]|uniref:hypothetical protein n=1 Tax=Gottfriedia sp. NPDC057948 TaxID=3346287 RepID=UPI0036DC72CF
MINSKSQKQPYRKTNLVKEVFNIEINPLAGGTELTVTVSDTAGNVSAPTTVKVLDKTAPSAPTINSIADNLLSNKVKKGVDHSETY